MTVIINDTTWLQWDWQIGTFRGEKDGEVFGEFTGDMTDWQSLADAMCITLTQEQVEVLLAEQAQSIGE